MQNRHPLIAYGYHFLSEGIIIFLVVLPLFYYVYEWVPYWSYLIGLVSICTLFSFVFWKYSRTYIYVLTSLLLIGLFYGLEYPFLLASSIAFLLLWRALNIKTKLEEGSGREQIYIFTTLVLTTILVLLIQDGRIIIYAFAQFLLLIVGNIVSHIAVIEQKDRIRINHKLWFYITGMLIGGIAIIYPILSMGRSMLTKGISWFKVGFIALAEKMGVLLWFLDPNRKRKRSTYIHDGAPGNPPRSETRIYEKIEFKDVIFPIIFWLFVIILCAVIVYILIQMYRHKRIVRQHRKENEAQSEGQLLPLQDQINVSNIRSRFQGLFQQPNHPIRKLLYQFELKLYRQGYGRHPNETIEDWFQRLQLNDQDIQLYQKVRYGNEQVNEEEIRSFKESLRKVQEHLKANLNKQ